MKAQIYRFKITYDEYGDKINRTVEVSSNYTLANLGFLVLAAFDTLAYHLFYISYNGKRFEIPLDEDDFGEPATDPREVRLNALGLNIGDAMEMVYDFGCEQTFSIVLDGISEMPKGTSTAYPRIVAGAGKGILDDVAPYDFGEIIKKIDKTGKSDHVYLSPYGTEERWDYRAFDIEEANRTLKRDISAIAQGFEE